MLFWSIVFLSLSVLEGYLGFGEFRGTPDTLAQVLTFIFGALAAGFFLFAVRDLKKPFRRSLKA